jgi:hypothetical protein
VREQEVFTGGEVCDWGPDENAHALEDLEKWFFGETALVS